MDRATIKMFIDQCDGMGLAGAADCIENLAAEVERLLAALKSLLPAAERFEWQASKGAGGRRGGPVFEKARAAIAAVEQSPSELRVEVERLRRQLALYRIAEENGGLAVDTMVAQDQVAELRVEIERFKREAAAVPEALTQEPLRGDEPIGPQASRADYVRGWNAYRNAMLSAAPAAPERPEQTKAEADVMAERHRQVESEGWTPEHDDQHSNGELAAAASCYAFFAANPDPDEADRAPFGWPWSEEWWKPTDTRRDLVKAGALILAEIERLDRIAAVGEGAE